MPTYQTTPVNPKAVHLGSAKIEVGTSSADVQNIGIADSIDFKEDFDPCVLEPDNSVDIYKGINKQTCTLSFNMWELDPSKIALLRGGIDSTGSTTATPVSITDEAHTLTSTKLVRLDHKNGNNYVVDSIVVTDSAGNPAAINTDYIIATDQDGYTCIARVSSSSVITSGEGVLVDYTYTPLANKTRSTGGLDTFNSRYIKVTNIDANGKKYQLEIYKAYVTGGLDMSFPKDGESKALFSKIEMKGICDQTRTAGDQLYKETDEQSV